MDSKGVFLSPELLAGPWSQLSPNARCVLVGLLWADSAVPEDWVAHHCGLNLDQAENGLEELGAAGLAMGSPEGWFPVEQRRQAPQRLRSVLQILDPALTAAAPEPERAVERLMQERLQGRIELSLDEAGELAAWVYDRWTGADRNSDPNAMQLPVWRKNASAAMEALWLGPTDRTRMEALLTPMVLAFCGPYPKDHNPELRVRLARKKLSALLFKIQCSPFLCGKNRARRPISLEALARGDTKGPAGIAQQILDGAFDHRTERDQPSI